MPTKKNNVKEYASHLEFLGYTTEISEDGKLNIIEANSDTRINIRVNVAEGEVLITGGWSGYDAKATKSKGFHDTLNNVNASTIYTKWYYVAVDDSDLILRIEAIHLGGYDKTIFGKLVESFNLDAMQKSQEFTEYIKD